MRKIKFERLTALSLEEAKAIRGGTEPKLYSTDSMGDTYCGNGTWQKDGGANCTKDC